MYVLSGLISTYVCSLRLKGQDTEQKIPQEVFEFSLSAQIGADAPAVWTLPAWQELVRFPRACLQWNKLFNLMRITVLFLFPCAQCKISPSSPHRQRSHLMSQLIGIETHVVFSVNKSCACKSMHSDYRLHALSSAFTVHLWAEDI